MTVITAEQRPEKIQALGGIRTRSVTAALALMTVITQLLLMDKINFTRAIVVKF